MFVCGYPLTDSKKPDTRLFVTDNPFCELGDVTVIDGRTYILDSIATYNITMRIALCVIHYKKSLSKSVRGFSDELDKLWPNKTLYVTRFTPKL